MLYKRGERKRKIILEVLKQKGEASAYDILKTLTSSGRFSQNELENLKSNIYYHLNRMAKEGIVKFKVVPADTSSGKKKIYYIP